jgi:uncharacterized protein YndB with AHSA1/START domain
MSSKFVYVIYIKTTPKKVWDALLLPQFTRQYFFGVTMETDWKVGSPWRMVHPDGSVTDAGEVLEVVPPTRLVLKWRGESPNLKREGYTHCTFDISDEGGGLTKLAVVHEAERDGSKTIAAISGGWPMILSNLKTLLETGKVLKFGGR